MSKKYTKTAAAGSSEDLALKLIDDLSKRVAALEKKLDNDTGVTDTDYEATIGAPKPSSSDLN